MGWTFSHRDRGITNDEWFAGEFDKGTIIHASATVNGVYYAAVESVKDPGVVFAFIALIRYHRNDYHNFGFKDMSETSGPVDADAPAKVLKALTDTDDTYALEWRDRCWHRIAQRKFLKDELRDDDKVVLTRTLAFTNGTRHNTFTVKRQTVRGGKTKAVLTVDGQVYGLPNWRDQVESIIRDDATGITTPVGDRAGEDSYVRRVDRMAYGKHREAINAHYGLTGYESPSWAARMEFRTTGPWGGLDDLEPDQMPVAA